MDQNHQEEVQLAGCYSRLSASGGLGCSQKLAFLLAEVQGGDGTAGLQTDLGNHWAAALTEARSLPVANMTVWRHCDLVQVRVFRVPELSLISLLLGWLAPELSPDWARMLIVPR